MVKLDGLCKVFLARKICGQTTSKALSSGLFLIWWSAFRLLSLSQAGELMEVTQSFLLQHPSVKETKSWEGKEVSSKAEPNEGVTHSNLLIFFKITTSVSFLSLTVVSHRVPCRVPSCKKKMCACFPGQGIKGPREERKSFCGKTLDTLNVLHLPKLELLFFF